MDVTITNLTLNSEPDRRYRTLVLLQRSGRPKYWTFHCPNCQQAVAELNGTDVYAMTDFYNPQNAANASVGMRCTSPMCRRWFFFVLQ